MTTIVECLLVFLMVVAFGLITPAILAGLLTIFVSWSYFKCLALTVGLTLLLAPLSRN